MRKTGIILSLLVLLGTFQLWAAELIIEDFETVDYLTVGGENFSSDSKVELDREQVKEGRGAAKFTYGFAREGNPRYAELEINRQIPINTGQVSVWVWGNNSGNPLRARIHDASGEIFQVTIGDLNWSGWALKEFELKAYPECWGGNGDGKLDLPLQKITLLVDSIAGTQRPAPLYFDELKITAEAGRIRGIVTDRFGVPIRGARVFVQEEPQLCGITDLDGTYVLWALSGTYNFATAIRGYESQTESGVQVLADQETTLDFLLSPAPDEGVFSDQSVGEEDGLYLLRGGDGWAGRIEEVGHRQAIVTDKSHGREFFYFNVDDGYIYGGENEVYVNLEYFDRGQGIISLLYDGSGDPYTLAGVVERGNSMEWKTATFHLPDAAFSNRQNGGADFRIGIWAEGYTVGADAYLGKVSVVKAGKIIDLAATPTVFSPKTGSVVTISYRLSAAGVVSCWVEDKNGKAIATIAEGKEAASGSFTWAGRNEKGEPVEDGIYYIKLAAQGSVWKGAQALTQAVEVYSKAPASPEIIEPNVPLTVNEPQVTITGKATPGAKVRVFLDGAPIVVSSADARGIFRTKVEGLSPGDNELSVTEVDGAGNESEPQAFVICYDPGYLASQLTVSAPEFNPEQGTELRFFLAQEREVAVRVLTQQGEVLGTILEPSLQQGEVHLLWDGKLEDKVLEDGKYLLELVSGSVLGSCSVQIASAQPKAPYLLLPGGQVSQGKVRFVWEGAPTACRYLVKIWPEGKSEDAQSYEAYTTSLQLQVPLKRGNWLWQVLAFDAAGNESGSEVKSFSVEPKLPTVLELTNLKGGPNPFAPNGNGRFENYQVSYSLSQAATVRVSIYNLAGREVYHSESMPQGVGDHYFVWDGRDKSGRPVASGLYLVVIFAENAQNKAPARGRLLVSVMN